MMDKKRSPNILKKFKEVEYSLLENIDAKIILKTVSEIVHKTTAGIIPSWINTFIQPEFGAKKVRKKVYFLRKRFQQKGVKAVN